MKPERQGNGLDPEAEEIDHHRRQDLDGEFEPVARPLAVVVNPQEEHHQDADHQSQENGGLVPHYVALGVRPVIKQEQGNVNGQEYRDPPQRGGGLFVDLPVLGRLIHPSLEETDFRHQGGEDIDENERDDEYGREGFHFSKSIWS